VGETRDQLPVILVENQVILQENALREALQAGHEVVSQEEKIASTVVKKVTLLKTVLTHPALEETLQGLRGDTHTELKRGRIARSHGMKEMLTAGRMLQEVGQLSQLHGVQSLILGGLHSLQNQGILKAGV
jgi:hypothetical protein